MTEHKYYLCDMCGEEFKDKELCEKHELLHKKPLKIVGCAGKCKSHMILVPPSMVDIKMENGIVCRCRYEE